MSIKKLGVVVAILNSRLVVIKTEQPLILGSEVLVYDEVKLEQLTNNDALGVSHTIIPKGKLKIIMLQEDDIYLASTISKKNALDSQENVSLARSLSLYSQIFVNKDIEFDKLDDSNIADYSAKLDTSKSLKADISPLVRPGDYITFVQPSNLQT